MKKAKDILYTVRIISFIIQFYFVFMISDAIIHTGFLGWLFVSIYVIYNIVFIVELLGERVGKKKDLIYNIMQLCYCFYMFIFFFRIRISNFFVGSETIGYFNWNFIILCILLVFILLYDFIEFKSEI